MDNTATLESIPKTDPRAKAIYKSLKWSASKRKLEAEHRIVLKLSRVLFNGEDCTVQDRKDFRRIARKVARKS